MLDLFSGLGGASRAMRERGWQVYTVDVDPRFAPDFLCDVRDFLDRWPGEERVDLLWASPPCDEFSRAEKPWYEEDRPSPEALSLVWEVFRIVRELSPKLWILENVRGAQRWLGKAPCRLGPFYLWGWFPFDELKKLVGNDRKFYGKTKLWPHPDRKELRAMIPYEISLAVAMVAERRLSQKSRKTESARVLPLFDRIAGGAA
ncbi:DNA cytosine methyltransferase [Thermosulfurimonas sp. F29]|uniref:DNA cytosine methyltransferase n=1 Tax=Thermosulfurimonas sp. F29 TaxID=2867247 RepID=UPI00210220AF|nr:DNA cytosine methyltransferase [Thermosulfurimonas sp. F29]